MLAGLLYHKFWPQKGTSASQTALVETHGKDLLSVRRHICFDVAKVCTEAQIQEERWSDPPEEETAAMEGDVEGDFGASGSSSFAEDQGNDREL